MADALISMLWLVASARSEAVLIADSDGLGVPGGWGGAWWVAVRARTVRRPWATCWIAKKVKTPVGVSCQVKICGVEQVPRPSQR